MAKPGELIAGRYRVKRVIGEGGSSKVYLAEDMHLHKNLALKEYFISRENRMQVAQGIREISIMKDISHRGIVGIIDLVWQEEFFYVVEDYVCGITLKEFIYRGNYDEERVIAFAEELAEVFVYLHSLSPPVIYRDLKPGNVMINSKGSVVLVDFGISKRCTDAEDGLKGYGTKGYSALELHQVEDDGRVDIYSYGVTIRELLMSSDSVNKDYRRGLKSLIKMCTAKNPKKRISSFLKIQSKLKSIRSFKKKSIKNCVFILSIVLVITVAFVETGIVNRDRKNSRYKKLIKEASLLDVSETKEKIDLLTKALEISPGDYAAYEMLIATFKQDSVLDNHEDLIIRDVVKKQIIHLKDGVKRGEIAFAFGELYWFYYQGQGKYSSEINEDSYKVYWSVSLERMNGARVWFENASSCFDKSHDLYDRTWRYLKIITFENEINLKIFEGDDVGEYKVFWQELLSLYEDVTREDSYISMGDTRENLFITGELVVNTIMLYREDLRRDGISFEVQRQVVNDVREKISEVSPVSSREEDRRNYIMQGCDDALLYLKES